MVNITCCLRGKNDHSACLQDSVSAVFQPNPKSYTAVKITYTHTHFTHPSGSLCAAVVSFSARSAMTLLSPVEERVRCRPRAQMSDEAVPCREPARQIAADEMRACVTTADHAGWADGFILENYWRRKKLSWKKEITSKVLCYSCHLLTVRYIAKAIFWKKSYQFYC